MREEEGKTLALKIPWGFPGFCFLNEDITTHVTCYSGLDGTVINIYKPIPASDLRHAPTVSSAWCHLPQMSVQLGSLSRRAIGSWWPSLCLQNGIHVTLRPLHGFPSARGSEKGLLLLFCPLVSRMGQAIWFLGQKRTEREDSRDSTHCMSNF